MAEPKTVSQTSKSRGDRIQTLGSDLLSEMFNFAFEQTIKILAQEEDRTILTVRMILLLINFMWGVKVIAEFLETFSTRRYFSKFWRHVDYQAEQDEWANLKNALAVKMDGKQIVRNKMVLYETLTRMRAHSLYRRFSYYNYMLPRIQIDLRKADTIGDFEAVQIQLIDAFSHVGWSLSEQVDCAIQEYSLTVAHLLGFVTYSFAVNYMFRL